MSQDLSNLSNSMNELQLDIDDTLDENYLPKMTPELISQIIATFGEFDIDNPDYTLFLRVGLDFYKPFINKIKQMNPMVMKKQAKIFWRAVFIEILEISKDETKRLTNAFENFHRNFHQVLFPLKIIDTVTQRQGNDLEKQMKQIEASIHCQLHALGPHEKMIRENNEAFISSYFGGDPNMEEGGNNPYVLKNPQSPPAGYILLFDPQHLKAIKPANVTDEKWDDQLYIEDIWEYLKTKDSRPDKVLMAKVNSLLLISKMVTLFSEKDWIILNTSLIRLVEDLQNNKTKESMIKIMSDVVTDALKQIDKSTQRVIANLFQHFFVSLGMEIFKKVKMLYHKIPPNSFATINQFIPNMRISQESIEHYLGIGEYVFNIYRIFFSKVSFFSLLNEKNELQEDRIPEYIRNLKFNEKYELSEEEMAHLMNMESSYD
jgi:hypothetical protein